MIDKFTTDITPYSESHTENAYASFQRIIGFLEGIATSNNYCDQLLNLEVINVRDALFNFRSMNNHLVRDRNKAEESK